ncbi:MAG: hypothetical protein M3P95_08270, partial [Actinomycetota bacterium]|nr:hypothetical protein [Actinomycetota bacterium]
MHPPDRLADIWTATVRSVLLQRGAVANAREAVLRDRWIASQRREAAVAAARSAGHPSLLRSSGGGGVPDPRRAPGGQG